MEVSAVSDQPFSTHEVEAVLAGALSYDDASPGTQAAVRREWDRRIAQARTRLDLAVEFRAQGRRWSECDADGKVVVRR